MYNVLEKLTIKTTITSNPYNFQQYDLFDVAARINKKRPFLFVSKVLGKHLAVAPQIPLLTGVLLAMRYKEIVENEQHSLANEIAEAIRHQTALHEMYTSTLQQKMSFSQKTIVIGFAETATALGHAFFSAFEKNAHYVHTTREQILGDRPLLQFEEEHSHATSHRLYAADKQLFAGCENVILVDDEMTTGQTNINIIRQLHENFPHIKTYTVASILDWRGKTHIDAYIHLQDELNITIHSICLMAGQMETQGQLDAVPFEMELPQQQAPVQYITKKASAIFSYKSLSGNGQLSLQPFIKQSGRWAITNEEEHLFMDDVQQIAQTIEPYVDGQTLVVGTGEFMYVPMQIAAQLGESVVYQSTTRSPIYAHRDTLIQQKFAFESPENSGVENYLYNIPQNEYDTIVLVVERVVNDNGLQQLVQIISSLANKQVVVLQLTAKVEAPNMPTIYNDEDVQFLLRDLSNLHIEKSTDERERLIQKGTHYAEMLPVEFHPNEAYMHLFYDTLETYGYDIAVAVGVVAERIKQQKPLEQLVLVSLARAGTPIGVLIKRYYEFVYNVSVPHYSISIVRGKGIDETAVLHMLHAHPKANLQFIDGWTGKGAITKELIEACAVFNEKYGTKIDDALAVLADPGECAPIYGTRDDFLIPSACLNSTVSGLVSRTVLNPLFLDEGDFHGAKYYAELADMDVSVLYIDKVVQHFATITPDITAILQQQVEPITWSGIESIKEIQQQFNIQNMHHVKPGVGETTRVLLRRLPWKILINPKYDNHLEHIYLLAEERGIEIVPYENMAYSCCGLIKELV